MEAEQLETAAMRLPEPFTHPVSLLFFLILLSFVAVSCFADPGQSNQTHKSLLLRNYPPSGSGNAQSFS